MASPPTFSPPGFRPTHNRTRRIGLAATAGVALLVLMVHHNRFWYPPDDGAYAHVAERLLEGDVLHGDVQDVHMGYVNFANAGALWLFGERLVSLRYPLIAIGVFAAAAAYWLAAAHGVWTGLAAGLAVTALSIVQFLNPTAHWYCFGLLWATIGWLTWQPRGARGRLLVTGFLLGLVFLFRQLTGVLVGMGVLAYLLHEETMATGGALRLAAPLAGRAGQARRLNGCGPYEEWAARAVCGVMFCGLLAYLWAKTDLITLIMYGTWPLALLAWIGRRVRTSNRRLAAMLGLLLMGAVIAAAPLVAYHVVHGSVEMWLADTVFRAESLTRLDFFREFSFPLLLTSAWSSLLSGGDLVSVLNALFWIAAFSAAPLLGMCVLASHGRQPVIPGNDGPNGDAAATLDAQADACGSPADGHAVRLSPLVVLAVFYGVVSLHFQIPIYLFYSLSVTLVALMVLHRERRPEWRAAASAPRWSTALVTVAVMAVVGFRYHAAQPASRTWGEIVSGVRSDDSVRSSDPRSGLLVPIADAETYATLTGLIEAECAPEDSILALPSNPELYFLTERNTPLRFFNAALGIAGEDQVQQAIRRLSDDPPRLVVFRPGDKYVTQETQEIMAWVRARYERLQEVGEFEVYRHRAGFAGAGEIPAANKSSRIGENHPSTSRSRNVL